jgi:hypothetical protein
MVMPAFHKFQGEAAIIGRLLAGYAELEIDLLNCVSVVRQDFDATLKAMFRVRGETARINVGDALGPLGVKMRRTRIEHILSALPPLTTEERTFGIGSSVPPSDQVHRSKIVLFDHLVGNCEQLVWHREAEGLGRLEIDNEQEFSRLFHWEIGRLCAF